MQDPPCEGIYRWRKDASWHEITREILKREDGTLVCFSSRYDQWLPLVRVLGQWNLDDINSAGRLTKRLASVA